MKGRVVADCRKMPSKRHCTLTIAGHINEVLPIAVYHAVRDHGHKNTATLRRQIKGALKKGR